MVVKSGKMTQVDLHIRDWFGQLQQSALRLESGRQFTTAVGGLNSIRRICRAFAADYVHRVAARRAILVLRCDSETNNFRILRDFSLKSLDYQKQVCIIELV